MAFIKQSSDFIENSKTEIDNIFINDYLPYAPSDFVKVYIYCNYISNSSDSPDNDLDKICKILNMSELDVMNALKYWENEGLLKLYGDPVQVMLYPLKSAISNEHKWNKSKYEEFNLIIQDITKRQILPNEFNSYYTAMETLKIEIPAFIMIVKFCVNQKGENVSYSYINTVAKNWADEGARTAEEVNNKIKEFEDAVDNINEVIKALKSKRKATFEDRQFYKKWTEHRSVHFSAFGSRPAERGRHTGCWRIQISFGNAASKWEARAFIRLQLARSLLKFPVHPRQTAQWNLRTCSPRRHSRAN